MTKRLKELMERAEAWPKEAQDEAVASLEAIEHDFAPSPLSDEDRDALARSAEDVRLGEYASDAEARKIFDRFRGT